MSISVPGYQILERLSETRNTRVYRGYRDADQLPVILRTTGAEFASIQQYAKLAFSHEVLTQFEHPNITRIVDWIDDQYHPCLVM